VDGRRMGVNIHMEEGIICLGCYLNAKYDEFFG